MTNIITINNTEHLTAMIKAIVPRSFEKTFGGLSTGEVVAGFAFCTMGLTQTELNTGLMKIKEMGFCPDPAVFAKWCKGLDGFDNTNAIAETYIGKAGALAGIKRWLDDKTAPITAAQKHAYDETYHMFEAVKYAKNADYAQTTADSAFKDSYEHIVSKLIKERVPCQTYVAPIVITQQQTKLQEHIPASREFVKAMLDKLQGINKMESMA